MWNHSDFGKIREEVSNGTRGTFAEIDGARARICWDGESASRLPSDQVRLLDRSYARTSQKEQEATNQRKIVTVSVTGARVVNRQAAHVADAGARENIEVATADLPTILMNADKRVKGTTAVAGGKLQKSTNRGGRRRRQSGSESVLSGSVSFCRSLVHWAVAADRIEAEIPTFWQR